MDRLYLCVGNDCSGVAAHHLKGDFGQRNVAEVLSFDSSSVQVLVLVLQLRQPIELPLRFARGIVPFAECVDDDVVHFFVWLNT